MDMEIPCISTKMKENIIEKLVNNSSLSSLSDDESISNEGEIPATRPKKCVQLLSESNSEKEGETRENFGKKDMNLPDTDAEDNNLNMKKYKIKKRTSRIQVMSSSESDDDLKEKFDILADKKYNLSRIKIKKKKLREKFINLVSRSKLSSVEINTDLKRNEINNTSDKSNESFDLCETGDITKKFEEKQIVRVSSICDPDTSDEENNVLEKQKVKPTLKPMKSTSPKPMRISAKQAMENRQKIKSESNRMLREKEVSLPYHKPKALSLKDIMSRRKPALASDGKALSVKMSAEQLQQYALMLEQRQKEMMELCKSDTDEEENTSDEAKKNLNIEDQGNDKVEGNIIAEDVEISISVQENKDNLTEILSKTDDIVNSNSVSIDCGPKVSNCLSNEIDSIEKEAVSVSENHICEKAECVSEEGNKEQKDGVNSSKIVLSKENDKELDSQQMKLQYGSENTQSCNLNESSENKSNPTSNTNELTNDEDEASIKNDFNFDEIDAIIQNFEDKNIVDDNQQINEVSSLKNQPKLTGSPGMLIDLDFNGSVSEKKLSGVELLKERYKYFAKLKTIEDQEKDREKKFKPGTQHLKLKQELEEQIAEQRSIEWAKRLEHEKQQQLELNAVRGDESDTDEIEKIEAKLEELSNSIVSNKESSESSEEEEEEEELDEGCLDENEARKRNPLIDDEAEETEEGEEPQGILNNNGKETNCTEDEDFDAECEASGEESSDDESSESDEEIKDKKPKKGRILKAFEDSDEEDNINNIGDNNNQCNSQESLYNGNGNSYKDLNINDTQDDELQLAQIPKSSQDMIESQTDVCETHENLIKNIDKDLGSQTFSIIKSQNTDGLDCLDKLVVKESALCHNLSETNFCFENPSQNLDSQEDTNILSQSQEIGDDIAALCTGKFYDNPFVSQIEENMQSEENIDLCKETMSPDNYEDSNERGNTAIDVLSEKENNVVINEEKKVLSSILEELDDPEFESPKQYKYFANNDTVGNKENVQSTANKEHKKRLVIDSDDDVDGKEGTEIKHKKKKKKRRLEERALQLSDDEDDDYGVKEDESLASDYEEDSERIVEYDSEENEVEVQPQKSKIKRVGGDFFEQEAELTSEDEWIGSGDEDEAGLDRMEREEGDDEVFHEGKLRRELGQIHMRDVLDQDKREVRLLQELLFEDGDLGDGHRQRKFRWKNADEVDDSGAAVDEFAETQEEEFESEEQWRKQRHERDVFLRKMKGEDEEDVQNVSINRTTIIKANLCSRTMSNLLAETETSPNEKTERSNVTEKKTHKDIPSPKKSYAILQQNYQGSLLTRGKGALARLAAIATPLAGDIDDTPKVSASSNRRNFVFAALTPDEIEPKVAKRKAEANAATPNLIKKMKTEEKHKHLRNSLFDYLET